MRSAVSSTPMSTPTAAQTPCTVTLVRAAAIFLALLVCILDIASALGPWVKYSTYDISVTEGLLFGSVCYFGVCVTESGSNYGPSGAMQAGAAFLLVGFFAALVYVVAMVVLRCRAQPSATLRIVLLASIITVALATLIGTICAATTSDIHDAISASGNASLGRSLAITATLLGFSLLALHLVVVAAPSASQPQAPTIEVPNGAAAVKVASAQAPSRV